MSSRCFIKTPLAIQDLGKVSPRAFCDYTLNFKNPDGGYFKTAVLNSFPDTFERTDFLNVFYQCLLHRQLSFKIPKLVVCGLRDSGKSSMANVFFGIINPSKIASVTKEKTFGMQMITSDTELIFIDEWCNKTLAVDDVKKLLQGGNFNTAVKHETARNVENNAGIYITCNEFPEFGIEQENVETRIRRFRTKSLEVKSPEAPDWIKDNAMQCLHWIINEINRNIDLLPRDSRFYERAPTTFLHLKKPSFPEKEMEKLRNVRIDDIQIVENNAKETTSVLVNEYSSENPDEDGYFIGGHGVPCPAQLAELKKYGKIDFRFAVTIKMKYK